MEKDKQTDEIINRNELATPKRDEEAMKKRLKVVLPILLLVLFVVLVIGFALIKLNQMTNIDHQQGGEVEQSEALLNVNSSNNSLAQRMKEIEEQRRLDEERKKALENEVKEQKKEQEQLTTALTNNPNQSNQEQVDNPRNRKMQGETLIGTDGSGSESEQSSKGLNSKLTGELFTKGSVTKIDKVNNLLIAGTTIPCVLKTKIVTNYPSMPVCQVINDIYSAKADRILIHKGATIRGEQKNALTQGDVKVFISWNTVDDLTTGNRLRIDSLGTDTLGASGSDAYINYRFFKRFGGAIMLSLIQDAISTAGNSTVVKQGKDNKISMESTQDGMSRMAEMALQNSINIPPIGYINQGEIINILLVRDIDFSGF